MSDRYVLVPDGEPVTLADCPIGLFLSASGNLCLKTEYSNEEGRIDAFIVSSGEFFWGEKPWGAKPLTIAGQRAQIVQPMIAPPVGEEVVDAHVIAAAFQAEIGESGLYVADFICGDNADHDEEILKVAILAALRHLATSTGE